MERTARLYHEFEAAFEYEETPDQLKAIEDIGSDMESTKPMDRLVCGDVGYGKTEVAMRAAFKAIEDEPPGRGAGARRRLLAHQHYDNFAERFAPFPTRVALLSRFQSPKETKAILKDVGGRNDRCRDRHAPAAAERRGLPETSAWSSSMRNSGSASSIRSG